MRNNDRQWGGNWSASSHGRSQARSARGTVPLMLCNTLALPRCTPGQHRTAARALHGQRGHALHKRHAGLRWAVCGLAPSKSTGMMCESLHSDVFSTGYVYSSKIRKKSCVHLICLGGPTHCAYAKAPLIRTMQLPSHAGRHEPALLSKPKRTNNQQRQEQKCAVSHSLNRNR